MRYGWAGLAWCVVLAMVACAEGERAPENGFKPDPACTREACVALTESCRQGLIGDIDAFACHRKALERDNSKLPTTPEQYDYYQACPELCTAYGFGPALQCIEQSKTQCEEMPRSASDIVSGCLDKHPSTQKKSGACQAKCSDARVICEKKCTADDMTACYNCSTACASAQAKCIWVCPTEFDHCTNETRDGNETGVDCGGDCAPCSDLGTACRKDDDCWSRSCQNGQCVPGQACKGGYECPSTYCVRSTCQ